MDYRPLPAEHYEAFRRMVQYAFGPERGPELDDEDPDRPDIFEIRALYDSQERRGRRSGTDDGSVADLPNEDDIAALCGYYGFTARVRSEWHPMGGVSAVASPPETRRQGHISELLGRLHEEFRDEGIYFAALWPFKYSFYRRFGYGMITKYAKTTLPPSELGDVAADPAGRFRRVDADEYESLVPAYEAWASEDLAVDRTEGWWRHRVFSGWRKDPYVTAWEDDDGSVRGYVVYTVDKDDGDGEKTMRVWEFAHDDDEAKGQLYRFCRDHDSQVDEIWIDGTVDTSLLETLSDPRAADLEVRPGPMFRIVDLEAAVAALDFPADIEGSVTLVVEDDACEWNDGVFELAVDADGAACRPTESDPDVRVEIGALSQLVAGFLPVETLERYGDLTVEHDEARQTLSAMFPEADVFLREGF